ncbi:MAG: glycoside hydrolase family 5 protein [Bacteroidales bacterium]|nr:glycoside hydrolase family 5 protein [Bacteroidales bacterium]
MNIKHTLLAAAVILLSACEKEQTIMGEWYGLRDKALVTLSFDEDGTFSITSESNSNYDIQGNYVWDKSAMTVDLPQTTNGMGAAGLYRFNPDGTLDLNLNFGRPGNLERPLTVGPDPSSYTNTYFHLSRDKASLEAELNPKQDIPAEAALAFERNKRLGAGINLNAVVDGNLHPGYECDAPLADDEIRSIAEVGFKSIRLDVCWAKHASFEYPYTIDPAFFAKVDHIVDVALDAGLAVSIDQHYYPYINMGGGDDNISENDNYERLVSFWEQIARHYKDYSDETLFFDLLNEPNPHMGADKWNEMIARLIKTIRPINPGRTIIVGTPNLGQHWTLNYLDFPKDEWNLIVEFHYYLPHLFTHQGLAYAMAEQSKDVAWSGTEEEKAPILRDLDYCQKWGETHGRPLNMGEYGAVNTADEASRCRYLGFMREASEARGFSSHLWGYREPFMIRDEKTGEWIQPILDAMKLK